MKKQNIFSAMVTALIGLLVFGCTDDPKHGPEPTCVISSSNLEALSCMLARAYFLKTIDSSGRTVYLSQNGDIYDQAQLRFMKNPFLVGGTGVVMQGGFVGTVAHIALNEFGAQSINEMMATVEQGDSTQLPFLRKLAEYVRMGKLSDPTSSPWSFHEINSFIILPGSPKIPIQESLENMPEKTPEYCAAIQLIFNDVQKDAAVYKIKGRIPDKIKDQGFTICDLMTVAEIKDVRNAAPIESWGYPENIRQWLSQTIAPKPAHGMVTGLPTSNFEWVETNLPMNQGGSGSFVIHKETGKVIGLVSNDGGTSNTTLLTPAHYLVDIYQNALDAEGNTSN